MLEKVSIASQAHHLAVPSIDEPGFPEYKRLFTVTSSILFTGEYAANTTQYGPARMILNLSRRQSSGR